MKMKTTKFLAVLAVLAFAFAAFAIATPAEDNDATIASEKEYISPGATAADTYLISGTSDNSLDGTKKVYAAESVTLTGVSAASTIYVKGGAVITMPSSTSAALTVIPVTESDKALTKVGMSLTFSASSALVITVSSDGKEIDLTGTSATISAGDIPAANVLKTGTSLKIIIGGALENNGTIYNNYTEYGKDYNNGIVTNSDAVITGTGTIRGTHSPQITMNGGSITGQTLNRADNLGHTYDCEESLAITAGSTVKNVTILAINAVYDGTTSGKTYQGHAVIINGLSSGTVSIDGLTIGSATGSAVVMEHPLSVQGCSSTVTITIKNVSYSNVTLKTGYAELNLTQTTTLSDTDATGLTGVWVKIDSSVKSVRPAGAINVGSDLELKNGIINKGAETAVSVAAGKTLTANYYQYTSTVGSISLPATAGYEGTVYYYASLDAVAPGFSATMNVTADTGATIMITPNVTAEAIAISGAAASSAAVYGAVTAGDVVVPGSAYLVVLGGKALKISEGAELSVLGTLETVNYASGVVGTHGIIGGGDVIVTGIFLAGQNTVTDGNNQNLVEASVTVLTAGTLKVNHASAGASDGIIMVGASGVIVLANSAVATISNNDNNTGSIYVFTGAASNSSVTIADISGISIENYLAATDEMYFAVSYLTNTDAALAVTISNNMVVPNGCNVYVDDGVTFTISATFTNNGAIYMDSANAVLIEKVTNGTTGKFVIDGIEYEKVATASSASQLTSAIASGDSVAVDVTAVITDKIDIGTKDVSLVLTTTDQTGMVLAMSDSGSLNINATAQSITGTVDVAGVTITLTGVKGDFTLVKGSAWISGSWTGGTIEVEANETLRIDDMTLATATDLNIILNDGSKVIFENDVIIGTNAVNIYTKNAGDSAKVEVEDGATIGSAGNITIGSAAIGTIKTTVEGDITIGIGKYLTVYGTMNLYATVSGNVINNGTINLYTGADISAASITGTGTIVDKTSDTDMEDLVVTGESAKGDITYSANQNVIVNGTWTLVKGAFITIKGALEVPEGSKIVIEPGAALYINNVSAVATINGALVVEDTDSISTNEGWFIVTVGTVNISGTSASVTVNGLMEVNGLSSAQKAYVNVTDGAQMKIAKTGALENDTYGYITVGSAATFEIIGSIATSNIYNYGTVTVNTSVPAYANSTIYQLADGAIVDVKKFTVDKYAYTLTISDENLVYYTYKQTGEDPISYYVGGSQASVISGNAKWAFSSSINTIVIGAGIAVDDYYAVVTGVTVAEKVTTSSQTSVPSSSGKGYVEPAEKRYLNTMLIAGEANVSLVYDGSGTATTQTYTGTITLNGTQGVTVPEDATLLIGLRMTVVNSASSYLTVKGYIDADQYSESTAGIEGVLSNAGQVIMSGEGLIQAVKEVAQTVNGAKIEVGTLPIYNYLSLDAALALANEDPTVTDIIVTGTDTYNVITKTVSIPKDVVFTLTNSATMKIGAKAGADVIVTVVNGATVKGSSQITVNGSLYAENQGDVKETSLSIISDVKKNEVDDKGKIVKTGWVLWTNVTTALNTAEIGEVITISKESGYVTISANTEIKEGRTLYVPEDMAPLYLKDGVTLTVSGVLVTEENIYAESMFGLTASSALGSEASAIIVKGAIYLPDTYSTYGTSTDGTYVKLSDGAPIAGAYYSTDDYSVISTLEIAIDDVEDIIGKITINGAVSVGKIAFVGTDDCNVITIGADLSDDIPTALKVEELLLSEASVTNSAAGTGTLTGIVADVNGYVEFNKLSGANFEIKERNSKLSLGGVMSVASKNYELSVISGTVYTTNGLTVTAGDYGYAAVDSGATLVIDGTAATFDNLYVYGTLNVANENALTITGDLTNLGSVIVADATSTKGSATLTLGGDLYLGMSYLDLIYSPAVIIGDVAILSGIIAPSADSQVFVAADANVDETAQAILDAMEYSVVFVVEDEIWFTLYSNHNSVYVPTAPVDDAFLVEWDDEYGYAVDVDGVIDITGYNGDVLTAKINYNIYVVTIVTDAGVKSVAIDNVELVTSQSANTFITGVNLAAGTHKVTYTLKDGYEGAPSLYTMDHTLLNNLSFTLSGYDYDQLNTGYYDLTLQLSGTQKEVTPEPEPTPVEKESEWNVTTILLLVLVILIAIMAVIVALRLNRS